MNTAAKFFEFVENEINNNLSNLSSNHLNLIKGYYKEAGLISKYKRSFFFNHYAITLEKVAAEMSKKLNTSDLIIDLGGGMGSQAIYFASKGFKVHVIDMDEDALKICNKRVKFYEKVLDKDLDITTRYANALDLNWASIGRFQAVYSLFAFNMMQPTEDLVQIICTSIDQEKPLIIIQDGNNQHPVIKFLRPRDTKSKHQLNDLFIKNGFKGFQNEALLSFPPLIHWLLSERYALKLEKKFSGILDLNISWLHTYYKI